MEIIKNKKVYICKLCKLKIEGEYKVKCCSFSNGKYYHLSCREQILNNTLRSLDKDKKTYWSELKKFNNLQEEIKKEKKMIKRQVILQNL